MAPRFDPSRLSPGWFAALFAGLLALSVVPLLLTDILPLVDYPNHLARMQLLASLPQNPVLRQFYALAWRAVPNLAMDALVPPLLRVMPLLWAGKVFVIVTFFLMAGGAAALHRVVSGSWSAWPCLVFLLLYNRLLLWGILNYLFGLGLALCAFAAWIALARSPPALRFVAGCIFAFLVYFAHLMAFGVYALLVFGYEAAPVSRPPRRLGAASARLALALVPLALPLAFMLIAGSGEAGGVIRFARPWRKLDLLFSVFDLYHRPFDVACFVLAVCALGYAYWRRWVALLPGFAVPLILLALAYLAMPSEMITAAGVDRRLPLALALVLCAGTAWRVPRPLLERGFLFAAGVMLVLRLGTVAASWQASGQEYRALLAGMDTIPVGSRVAVAYPATAVNVVATPLVHLPVLAVARRSAFVPTLFAYAGQQPIELREPYRDLAAQLSSEALWDVLVGGPARLDAALPPALSRYDDLILTAPRPFSVTDSARLAPLFVTPRFQIYRLIRRGGESPPSPAPP